MQGQRTSAQSIGSPIQINKSKENLEYINKIKPEGMKVAGFILNAMILRRFNDVTKPRRKNGNN